MSEASDRAFFTFVRSSCGDLVGSVAEALEFHLSVRDVDGETMLAAGTPSDSGEVGHGTTEELSAAIRVEGETVGYVVGRSGESRHRKLVESLAKDIASRFRLQCDLEHMTDELSQCFDEINLLYEFSRILKPDDGFVANAHRLVDQTADLLERRLLVLALPEWNCFVSSAGPSVSMPDSVVSACPDPVSLRRIYEDLGETVRKEPVCGPRRLEWALQYPCGGIGYVVIPVWIHSTLAGFVGLLVMGEQEPTGTGELRLLECLADQITNTAEKHELNRDLRMLLFNTVKSLVAAIEANDPYTRGHSERVLYIACLMGERLGLSQEDLQTLGWAALLHDIGKLGIDRRLLNKRTGLNGRESQVIRDHPERGCKILEPILQLRPCLPGIRHHHERFDGTGYPDGLTGGEIPLMSRIIAIADAFDAMSSARSYRSAAQKDEALQEITSMAGIQFDPELVDVFLEIAADEAFPEEGWHEQQRKAA